MSRKALLVAVLFLFVGAAPFVLAPPGFDEDERPQIPPPPVEPVSVPRPDAGGPEPTPEPTGITVRVRVIDESARALPGARVTILHRNRLIGGGTTGDSGELVFRNVPPGSNTEVRASFPGLVCAEDSMDSLDPRDAVLRLVRGVRFAGVVLAHGGERPVAGAGVSVDGVSLARLRTETAADGTFTFDAIPVGSLIDVDVGAGADGWVRFDEIIPAPGEPFRIVLPAVHELCGRVVDGDNKPVAGVRVESWVAIWSGSIHGGCFNRSRRDGRPGVTDAAGRFRLRDLTRCGYPRICLTGWRLSEASGAWPDEGEEIVLQLEPVVAGEADESNPPSPGSIRGRIEVPGDFVVAEIHARREVRRGKYPTYKDWHSAWCRPDGSFEIKGLACAEYDLSVETVGHEDLRPGGVTATAEGIDVGVLRPSPLITRCGWVTAVGGAPLPSASVAGRPVGPDGSFSVEIDKALSRRASISAPGYVTRHELPPERGEWVVPLTPVQVVEGIVLDVAGKPIPSVRLHASSSIERTTKSDLAGRFRLTYREPGEYGIFLSADGHEFVRRCPVRAGDLKVVIRAVESSYVGGRVVDDVDMPIPGAIVRIGRETVSTDAEGRFRIADLLGHSFAIQVLLDGADLAIRPVNDVPPNTGDLVLRARRGLPVTGTIIYPDGRLARNLDLYAEADGHAAPDRDTITDADGRFVLRGLLPGRWSIGTDICDEDVENAWWEGHLTGVRPGDRDVVLRLVWFADEEEDMEED